MPTAISKEVACRFAREESPKNENVIITISAPKGTKFRPIFSRLKESEVLLDKGTKLKVEEVSFKNNNSSMRLKCTVVK